MGDLAPTDIARAVTLIEIGRSYSDVAEMFGKTKSTIHRNVTRWRQTGEYVRRRGQGRKRSTTAVDDRFLTLHILRNRRLTAVQTRNQLEEVRGTRIGQRTVRRRLKEVGIKSYRPKKAPKLQRRHRVARLAFAREHQNWTNDQWSKVLFTDESRFCINSIDGRERLYRRPGEQNEQFNFTPTVSFGGGSIMVWGGICLGARTELVVIDGRALNADRYIRDVLQCHVVPFAPHIGANFLLMQDNARPHVARCVNNFLNEVEIPTMNWPACSPDLNPIEHVWDMLGRRLRSIIPAVQNTDEVRAHLVEIWENLAQEMIDNVIKSMGRRMTAVIRARGGNTRY